MLYVEYIQIEALTIYISRILGLKKIKEIFLYSVIHIEFFVHFYLITKLIYIFIKL